ncbi:Major facilitator-type transporter ecdC [Paramyrothecium foliicola]|nr:Major facilitator-type transporter ecdC [Paramyrothecium foliicola]
MSPKSQALPTVVAALDAVEDQSNTFTENLEAKSTAARFTDRQNVLTKLEAIKESRWSLAWCMYMCFLCVTWGFEGTAGSIVVSIVQFRKDFGSPYEGDYVLDASWQLGFQGITSFGVIAGAWLGGLGINRWGRQPVLLSAILLSLGGIFLRFFSSTIVHFFGSNLLTGLPLGVYTTVAPPYVSEMAPISIRGAAATALNVSIVVGQLLGYGVVRGTNMYTDSRAYQILFASEWAFAAVSLAFLPWLPESPYWMTAHGQELKAQKTVRKLYGPSYDVDGHLADIRSSLARQNQNKQAQGSFTECFSRQEWKRTMLACSIFFIQQASGSSWVIGYMSYYFQLAGMQENTAFDTTVGLMGLMVVGSMSGWFFVDRFGGRATAFWGAIVLATALLLIGVLSQLDSSAALWTQVVFMAIWSFSYQATLGAVAWPISAEAPTSRLRAPTQALATMTNGLIGIAWQMALPYAINPDRGNLGGNVAFVFTGLLGLCALFIFFAVPETKGLTYTEIDDLWNRGTPPRKFNRAKTCPLPKNDAHSGGAATTEKPPV